MNKIAEEIKLSIEKEYLTSEMLNDIKNKIQSNLAGSKLLSIIGEFTKEEFSVSVSDVDGNEEGIAGKITPNMVEPVVSFIDDVFKDNIDWDKFDLKADNVTMSLSLDFVDGKFLEKYNEAEDKMVKQKYGIGSPKEVDETTEVENLEDINDTPTIDSELESLDENVEVKNLEELSFDGHEEESRLAEFERLYPEEFNIFKNVVLKSDSFVGSYDAVKQINNIPAEVGEYFGKKYNTNNMLTMSDAWCDFYNEIKSSITENEDITQAEVGMDELEAKEPLLEIGESSILFEYSELDVVVEEFSKHLNKSDVKFKINKDKFYVATEDLQWMDNTLTELKQLGIGVIVETNETPAEEKVTVITEDKMVAVDCEVTLKGEKFIVVFEQKNKETILDMLNGGELNENVEFEYIPFDYDNAIVEEFGNRLFVLKDEISEMKVELVNETRILM